MLAKKLKLKPGQRAVVINAPKEYVVKLGASGDAEVSEKVTGTFDWVQMFASNQAELAKLLPKAVKALRPDGTLWISFPKGSSKIQTDLTRDQGWDSLVKFDLKWITLISVDDTWSAFALRRYREGEPKQV